MRMATQRFFRITLALLLLFGIALILISVFWRTPQADPVESFWSFIFELGTALTIAGVIALVFERLLSRERTHEISSLWEHYHKITEFGFNNVYISRQAFFNDLFGEVLPKAKHELKILGICISLFKEAGRHTAEKSWNETSVRNTIIERLKQGCTIQVLFLKRKLAEKDTAWYGLKEEEDFYFMRERDEDEDRQDFFGGKRLRKIANQAVEHWIRVLLDIASEMQGATPSQRKEVLERLQLREYLALPSLSLYIIDDVIYITPYLFRRHCGDVPLFKVVRENSPLYQTYAEHFRAIWNDKHTSSLICDKFLRLLAENPSQTIADLGKKHKEISGLSEDGIHYEEMSAYEEAIRRLVGD